ncbi:MAG: carbonate dehydratase [Methanosarcinaceae archaeon]|nr:carbonate dehydratase [Methanosarcinaceae archaeon]MDD4498455.1 carbonate dehydratase [Methanosarcinaceae archaeon]
MISQNPQKQYPKISKKAWISETAVIIGNVSIEENVFVAPYAVIRADEPGSSIVIKKNCNVQDNVILHGLAGSEVFIGSSSSLAHGCIVHGPCRIEEGCFVGFGAVVFDCVIGRDSLVLHNSTVRGVEIPFRRVVPDGMTISSQNEIHNLEELTEELAEFKRTVIEANIELVQGYRELEEN